METRSERRKSWESQKTLRHAIGWVAILIGISGLVWITLGIGAAYGFAEGREDMSPLSAVFSLAIGAGLVRCAFGLWDARQWARWVVVALCGLAVAGAIVDVVTGRAPQLGVLAHVGVAAYLLLPSTGRHFARAQALTQAAPARR